MTTREYKTCPYCIHEGDKHYTNEDGDINGYTCKVKPGIYEGTTAQPCNHYTHRR